MIQASPIIPYQELSGNYNAVCSSALCCPIIPYQELSGKYNRSTGTVIITQNLYHTKNHLCTALCFILGHQAAQVFAASAPPPVPALRYGILRVKWQHQAKKVGLMSNIRFHPVPAIRFRLPRHHRAKGIGDCIDPLRAESETPPGWGFPCTLKKHGACTALC